MSVRVSAKVRVSFVLFITATVSVRVSGTVMVSLVYIVMISCFVLVCVSFHVFRIALLVI